MHHRRALAILTAAALCALGPARPSAAVIVSDLDPLPTPLNGWVGWWNGSSAVAVGPHWIISAKHVGGSVGQSFIMKGVYYRAVEIRPHTMYDVQIIRVAEDLPGWHRLSENHGLGDPCVLGGFGVTAAAALPDNAGYDWNGQRKETWGANVIEADGNMLGIRFDAPSNEASVPHEATYGVNDSGAGLFVYGPDGSLRLAGIAVSVTSFGTSPWGCAAFALNVDMFRTWMQPVVDPAAPVSSAVVAPRAMLAIPGLPAWAGGAAACAAMISLRRRRACAP